MFKKIFFVVLFYCSLKQNYAYVLPLNAGNAGYGAESSVSDHQLDKKSPQSFFPDFPFESTPNANDALFPDNLPQFGMQFATNGLQTGLSTGYDIPFQSGNVIDPGGNLMRDLGQQNMFNQPLPPNGVVTGTMQTMNQNGNQPPVFKTETFNMGPDGQQLYENGRLVESSPNQQQNMAQQGTNLNTPNVPQTPQNLTPQVPTGTGTQASTGNLQQPMDPSIQSSQNANPNSGSPNQQTHLPNPQIQQQLPTYPGSQVQPSTYPAGQGQQPVYSGAQSQQPGYQTQPNPVVKMSSAGASSSTFVSSTNNQPPQMAQNAGAYNYNYDSTKPDPVNGNYLAVNGYTPNMYDPNQGNYQYTQGSFPTQQNAAGHIPNPLSPNQKQGNSQYPQQLINQQTPGGNNSPMFTPGNTNYKQGLPQVPLLGRQYQQLPHQPPFNNNQNYSPQQGFLPHFPIAGEIQQHIGRLNNQLSSLGVGMPQIDPSAIAAPMTQFMQTIPLLVRNAANQGLQISKMPFDMLNAALDVFNTDLSNVRVNEFVQIPTEGGRAIVNTIEEIINQFQRNLQTMQPNMQPNMQMQPNFQSYQQPATLARRSAEPWMMPNFDMNQMSSYYNSIPFGTAQEKINTMKNDILSKMPAVPSFNQMNQPFNYFSTPQIPKMSQMPQIPQSSNGEPVVKVYSSSVSESTSSSSKNGGPPEVHHQAAGSKYDYDSTRTDNPVQSDLVALKGYTPDASDPSKGTYVAYENSYP